MTTLMNKNDGITEWKSWNRSERISVGTWFLDCLMESSGWFKRDIFMSSR